MAALGRAIGAIPGARALLDGPCATIAKYRSRPKLAGVPRFMDSLEGAYFLRRSLFLPAELPALIGEDMARDGLAKLGGDAPGVTSPEARDAAAAVGMLESTLYLRNQLLRDSDWASMAHSLELRTPLADAQLRNARANSRPRAALARPCWRMPNRPLLDLVVKRRKAGFNVPMASWLSSGLITGRGRPASAGVGGHAVGAALGGSGRLGDRMRVFHVAVLGLWRVRHDDVAKPSVAGLRPVRGRLARIAALLFVPWALAGLFMDGEDPLSNPVPWLVVLGGGIAGERIDVACQLYSEGHGREGVVLSGGRSSRFGHDRAVLEGRCAVPGALLHEWPNSTDSFEEMSAVATLLSDHPGTHAIVVSDSLHMPRLRYIRGRVGLTAECICARAGWAQVRIRRTC